VKVYRVENPTTRRGLWYGADGRLDPVLFELSAAKCRDLPMGFDPEMAADGLSWVSAAERLDDLPTWISAQDAAELYAAGHRVLELTVSRYRMVSVPYSHAVFAREHILSAVPLPLRALPFGLV
jgi:hypothetical protein